MENKTNLFKIQECKVNTENIMDIETSLSLAIYINEGNHYGKGLMEVQEIAESEGYSILALELNGIMYNNNSKEVIEDKLIGRVSVNRYRDIASEYTSSAFGRPGTDPLKIFEYNMSTKEEVRMMQEYLVKVGEPVQPIVMEGIDRYLNSGVYQGSSRYIDKPYCVGKGGKLSEYNKYRSEYMEEAKEFYSNLPKTFKIEGVECEVRKETPEEKELSRGRRRFQKDLLYVKGGLGDPHNKEYLTLAEDDLVLIKNYKNIIQQ